MAGEGCQVRADVRVRIRPQQIPETGRQRASAPVPVSQDDGFPSMLLHVLRGGGRASRRLYLEHIPVYAHGVEGAPVLQALYEQDMVRRESFQPIQDLVHLLQPDGIGHHVIVCSHPVHACSPAISGSPSAVWARPYIGMPFPKGPGRIIPTS